MRVGVGISVGNGTVGVEVGGGGIGVVGDAGTPKQPLAAKATKPRRVSALGQGDRSHRVPDADSGD